LSSLNCQIDRSIVDQIVTWIGNASVMAMALFTAAGFIISMIVRMKIGKIYSISSLKSSLFDLIVGFDGSFNSLDFLIKSKIEIF